MSASYAFPDHIQIYSYAKSPPYSSSKNQPEYYSCSYEKCDKKA
jgi:hypothetical protein